MSIEEKYNILLETLDLVLLPRLRPDATLRSQVSLRLTELEGDAHTYLHSLTTIALQRAGYLSQDDVKMIAELRQLILEIPSYLWEPDTFIWDLQWVQVRNITLEIALRLEDRTM